MTTKGEELQRKKEIFEAVSERIYACAVDGHKSCWNCKHSMKSPGYGPSFYDPGEPPMAECDAPDKLFSHMTPEEFAKWDEKYCEGEFEEDAEECKLFEPLLVVYCDECEQPSDLPLYKAQNLTVYDTSFYCCDECYQKAKAKLDKEIAEGWI